MRNFFFRLLVAEKSTGEAGRAAPGLMDRFGLRSEVVGVQVRFRFD